MLQPECLLAVRRVSLGFGFWDWLKGAFQGMPRFTRVRYSEGRGAARRGREAHKPEEKNLVDFFYGT